MTVRYLDTTALPYRTYNSPTSTDPVYQDGANAIVSQKGYAECRPGFGTLAIPGPFTGTIRRIFTWDTWDSDTKSGSFFGMVCSTDNSNSYVYKYEFGADGGPIPIHTCTTSNNPFSFVTSNNTCYFGNGVDMKKYEGSGTTVYNWGITAPSTAATFGSAVGAYTTTAGGAYYFYTYVRESNNHESSPSPIGTCTGNASSKKYRVTVNYSSDPQVSHVYLYRTTDGGQASSETARYVGKIENDPNGTTGDIYDETLDVNLGSRTAPADKRNDPPPPMFPDCTYAGRIAGHLGKTVYYSGFEEISLNGGVPEECFPSDAGGNYKNYARKVGAVSPVVDGVIVYLSDAIHKIEGDSLDTFRFYKMASRQGVRNQACVQDFGGMSVWLDTSSSVWLLGGSEMSLPIRDTLYSVDSSTAQVALHFQNEFRWLMCLDTDNSIIYAMDTDTGKWFVPWTFAKSVTAIHSGETAAGIFDCLIAYNGEIWKMTPSIYMDGYDDFPSVKGCRLRTNLWDIVPEGVKYGDQIFKAEPLMRGEVQQIAVERNDKPIQSCKLLLDDDTDYTAGYNTLATKNAPWLRQQGTLLQEDWFAALTDANNRAARRCSIELNWNVGGWKFYSLAIEYGNQQA